MLLPGDVLIERYNIARIYLKWAHWCYGNNSTLWWDSLCYRPMHCPFLLPTNKCIQIGFDAICNTSCLPASSINMLMSRIYMALKISVPINWASRWASGITKLFKSKLVIYRRYLDASETSVVAIVYDNIHCYKPWQGLR